MGRKGVTAQAMGGYGSGYGSEEGYSGKKGDYYSGYDSGYGSEKSYSGKKGGYRAEGYSGKKGDKKGKKGSIDYYEESPWYCSDEPEWECYETGWPRCCWNAIRCPEDDKPECEDFARHDGKKKKNRRSKDVEYKDLHKSVRAQEAGKKKGKKKQVGKKKKKD